jgi:hypothetical protein
MADLMLAFWPVLGILAFAWLWPKVLQVIDALRPGWVKTPNFYSLALAVGITVFMTQALGAFLSDPLAMDKIQVSMLQQVFTTSAECSNQGYTPVLLMECRNAPLGNYSDYYEGVGLIPYGSAKGCACEWVTNSTK